MDFIYTAFGAMLKFFNSITGHYALALVLYALVFKILFLPFAIKQQKNQIKMAKLTPKIELIKAKYRGRNDQVTLRKQQEEIMELQRKEGYSPLSGCLPLLLQFPIIIWLYKVIRMPLTYIMGWEDGKVIHYFEKFNPGVYKNVNFDTAIDQIKLISQMRNGGYEGELPNFMIGSMNLGEEPVFTTAYPLVLLLIFPILAALFQWFQMWLTRKLNGNPNALGQDPQSKASMKLMDAIMPLMTFFIAYSFSAMMGLYWIIQSVISIIQTLIISKLMPMPKYTPEQLKEMRKEQKAAEKAQKAILKSQPKYRSLHYIDEDDYDELPDINKKKKRPEDKPKNDTLGTPEIKD